VGVIKRSCQEKKKLKRRRNDIRETKKQKEKITDSLDMEIQRKVEERAKKQNWHVGTMVNFVMVTRGKKKGNAGLVERGNEGVRRGMVC